MTWANKIKQLGIKHKKADKDFKADFIHQAFQGKLGLGQSQSLAYQIEDAMDYIQNPREYAGAHRNLYEVLKPISVIDFVGKYMEESGLVETRRQAKEITDAFLSAEEHVEFRTPVDLAMEAFDVEDTAVVGTATTGVSRNQIPEYSRTIDVEDGYSPEEIERLSNETTS
jgi:hypothetical protein